MKCGFEGCHAEQGHGTLSPVTWQALIQTKAGTLFIPLCKKHHNVLLEHADAVGNVSPVDVLFVVPARVYQNS